MSRPTFAAARAALLDHLEREGWRVARGLKVPHATSRGWGRDVVRIWFKPQAVYWSCGEGGSVGQARSLWIDIRDASPEAVERAAVQACGEDVRRDVDRVGRGCGCGCASRGSCARDRSAGRRRKRYLLRGFAPNARSRRGEVFVRTTVQEFDDPHEAAAALWAMQHPSREGYVRVGPSWRYEVVDRGEGGRRTIGPVVTVEELRRRRPAVRRDDPAFRGTSRARGPRRPGRDHAPDTRREPRRFREPVATSGRSTSRAHAEVLQMTRMLRERGHQRPRDVAAYYQGLGIGPAELEYRLRVGELRDRGRDRAPISERRPRSHRARWSEVATNPDAGSYATYKRQFLKVYPIATVRSHGRERWEWSAEKTNVRGAEAVRFGEALSEDEAKHAAEFMAEIRALRRSARAPASRDRPIDSRRTSRSPRPAVRRRGLSRSRRMAGRDSM